MSTQENVQIVKDFFAVMGRGDKQGLLALTAEDVEWVIPGEGWPVAGQTITPSWGMARRCRLDLPARPPADHTA